MKFVTPDLSKLKRAMITPTMAVMTTVATVGAMFAPANDVAAQNIKMTVQQDVNDLDRIAKLLAENLEAQIPADQSEEFSLDMDLQTLMTEANGFKAGDLDLLAAMTPAQVDAFLLQVQKNFSEDIRDRGVTLEDDFKKLISNIPTDLIAPFDNRTPAEIYDQKGLTPDYLGALDRAFDNPNDKIGGHTFAELWKAEAIANGVQNPDISYAYKGRDEDIEAGNKTRVYKCTIDCVKDDPNYRYAYTWNMVGTKLSDAVNRKKGAVQFGSGNNAIILDLSNAEKSAQNIKFFNHVYGKENAYFSMPSQASNMELVEQSFEENGVIYNGLSVPTGIFQGTLGTQLSDMAFRGMEGPDFLALIKSYGGNRIRDLLLKAAKTGDMSIVTLPLQQTMPNLTVCRDQIRAIVNAHMGPFKEFRPGLTSAQAQKEITLADVIQIYAIRYLAENKPEALNQYILQLRMGPGGDVDSDGLGIMNDQIADCIEKIKKMYGVVVVNVNDIKFTNASKVTVSTYQNQTTRSFGNFDHYGSVLVDNAISTQNGVDIMFESSLPFDSVPENFMESGDAYSDYGINFGVGGGFTQITTGPTDVQYDVLTIDGKSGFQGFKETFPNVNGRLGVYVLPVELYGSFRTILNSGKGPQVDNFVKKGATFNGALGANVKLLSYHFNNNKGALNLGFGAERRFNDMFGPKAGDREENVSEIANILARPFLSDADLLRANDYFAKGQGIFESSNGQVYYLNLSADYKAWNFFVNVARQNTELGIKESLEPYTNDDTNGNGEPSPLAIPNPIWGTNVTVGVSHSFAQTARSKQQVKLQKMKVEDNKGNVLEQEGPTYTFSDVSNEGETPKYKAVNKGNRSIFNLNKTDNSGDAEAKKEALKAEADKLMEELENDLNNKTGSILQQNFNRSFGEQLAEEDYIRFLFGEEYFKTLTPQETIDTINSFKEKLRSKNQKRQLAVTESQQIMSVSV
ncbi:MAG: hypothetical protein KDJ35_07360 [Alphaproteobacteria bacterium]|nr:hypothetical protein [Alphaproteobacteria bacterium]